jgi:nondiscriminating glutamyl-tRNA synthetase
MTRFRLRYAPSPTGYLHIGNTRTALMNYLFAKHYDGDFIIRIEDTDLERNVDDAIDSQFDNMEWLGILADESIKHPVEKYGPYMQSEKFDRYKELAYKLVDDGFAYRCFCTSEELEKEREEQSARGIVATKYSRKCLSLTDEQVKEKLDANEPFNIRFKVPENKTYTINDLVRGQVKFESKEIGDFVILKTNGIPTYNFAVVIDDRDMEITHVVRGEEHISNTPRQIMIYETYGWEIPKFCHLTLIVDDSKKKLSKRSGNALFFISQYKSQGYLPEAVFNFVSLLGWSPKEEREIYTKEELIKIFDETRFSKSPSTFDMGKLKWMNNQWMKKIDNEYYLNFVKSYIDTTRFPIANVDQQWLDNVLLLFKNEISCAIEINDHLDIFFEDVVVKKELQELLATLGNWKELIIHFEKQLTGMTEFNEDNIKKTIKELGQELQVKGKELFMPIRIAATTSEHGPELAKVICLLGQKKVLANIQKMK